MYITSLPRLYTPGGRGRGLPGLLSAAATTAVCGLAAAAAAAALLGLVMPAAADEVVPAELLDDVVLGPKAPYRLRVSMGKAKFLPFSCGGPANAMITLESYSLNADPLIFVSLESKLMPSFGEHELSSFDQWREDAPGSHYLLVKAVGPQGGLIGLLNVDHFAAEELDAMLSVKCSQIVAFETLFWDHIRASDMCPYGKQPQGNESLKLCSGHGQCGKNGLCSCGGDWTGSDCGSRKDDIVVKAHATYDIQLPSGDYRYFRLIVPPNFPGGFVEVSVESDQPVVILVRRHRLPTKNSFDLSNFDDWINGRMLSSLKYKVLPPGTGVGFASAEEAEAEGEAEEVEAAADEAAAEEEAEVEEEEAVEEAMEEEGEAENAVAASNVSDSPSRKTQAEEEQEAQEEEQEGHEEQEEQEGKEEQEAQKEQEEQEEQEESECPRIIEPLQGPACETPGFMVCTGSCMRCIECTKGGQHDDGCTEACAGCTSLGCKEILAACAGPSLDCSGANATACVAGCDRCMQCIDSNDAGCSACECCSVCLPVGAKCDLFPVPQEDDARAIYVGILNHRRFYNERPNVRVKAFVKLTEDPKFEQQLTPKSWVADLYDTFTDIQSLEVTQSQNYPADEQFLYEIDMGPDVHMTSKEVRIYDDRMTLLHVRNLGKDDKIEIQFMSGPNITHILSSSAPAPKTLFDFDKLNYQVGGDDEDFQKDDNDDETASNIHIITKGQDWIWCALFGGTDGSVDITVRTFSGTINPLSNPGPESLGSFAWVFGLALLCIGLLWVARAACKGARRAKMTWRNMDPNQPISERLAILARSGSTVESESGFGIRDRAGISLQGYNENSDEVDCNVEEQHLHRGGIVGDDGI